MKRIYMLLCILFVGGCTPFLNYRGGECRRSMPLTFIVDQSFNYGARLAIQSSLIGWNRYLGFKAFIFKINVGQVIRVFINKKTGYDKNFGMKITYSYFQNGCLDVLSVDVYSDYICNDPKTLNREINRAIGVALGYDNNEEYYIEY